MATTLGDASGPRGCWVMDGLGFSDGEGVNENDKSSWKEICKVWQALFRIDIIERFKSFLDSSMIFHEMRRERPRLQKYI